MWGSSKPRKISKLQRLRKIEARIRKMERKKDLDRKYDAAQNKLRKLKGY